MGDATEYGALYFYTSTIHNHRKLLWQYKLEQIIIDSLLFLYKKGCIRVYGFVIMPNHIHLIWQLIKPHGKESPVASFKKYTAHLFLDYLRENDLNELKHYQVDWTTRKYNFWEPNPDWFLLTKEKTTVQKLNYIHMNPLQERWMLVLDPCGYRFSSAKFYETGAKDFEFLFDYRDFIDREDHQSSIVL